MKITLKLFTALVALTLAGTLAWGTGSFLISDYYGTVGFVSLDGDGTIRQIVDPNSPDQISTGSYGVGLGDFDNDGLDDYVIGGVTAGNLAEIEFHKSTGPNQFAAGTPISGAGGWYYYVMDFAVADYDHDGNLDFAVNDYMNNAVHVYRGHGDGTFDRLGVYPLGFYSIAMDAADVNNDGNPDFIATRYYDPSCYYYYNYAGCTPSKKFGIFLGDGHGNFVQSTQEIPYTPPAGGYYYYNYSWGVAVADFDGDGKADAAVDDYTSGDNNVVLVFRGNGDGTFQPNPIRAATGNPYSLASLDNDDVNQDGIQDLVYAREGYKTVEVYLGRGDGTFTLASTMSETVTQWLTGLSTRPGDATSDRRPPVVVLDAPASLTNNRVLTVTGNASDSGGIASVELVQNGTVVDTSAPGANGAYSATITLAEGANDLVLRATDRAGNVGQSAHLTTVLDTAPPQVSLSALAHYATDPAFAWTGSASDANGIASAVARLNGASVGALSLAADGSFSAAFTLIAGTNSLEIDVTDAAGNTTTLNGQIVLDTAGPVITLDPLPAFTNRAATTITGGATDDTGVDNLVLSVNGAQLGAPFTLDASGRFHVDVVLAEGTNTISVQATDLAGLKSSARVGSLLDTVPPTANLATLPAYINTTQLAVTGLASDGDSNVASATLRVLGGADTAVTPGPDGSVGATLALTEGRNTIVLEVTDRAGNVGSTAEDVVVDTIPPVIAIAAPRDGQPFGTTAIPVAASVTDATPTTLGFGSLAFHFGEGGGTATGVVDVAGEGANTIPLVAVDAAGNQAIVQVAFVVDLTAPVADLDLGGLADGANLGPQPNNQLLYTLHVDDLTAVTIADSWDATQSSFPAGGGVLQGIAPIVEGKNVLSITATDAVGHQTVVNRTVTYDVTPPTASLTGLLATGGVPVRGTAELSAAATDNLTGVATVVFDVDGVRLPAVGANANYVAALDSRTLTDGTHTVVATFTDGVGNATTLSSTIVVDNTAPTVAVTSPTTGAYLRQTIAITAAASDATSGVADVTIAVNGGTIGHCAASPCTLGFDTSTLANGSFLVTATARDSAGNTASADQTAIADNSAPSKFLVSPISGATMAGSATVTVHVVDDGFSKVECFVDGKSLGASSNPDYSTSISLLDKLDGAVVVTCSASDLAGNVGTESATIRVKNWKLRLEPRTLSLKSEGDGVKLEVEGPNVALLLPVGDKALSLVVTGGSPAPLVTKRNGYKIETEIEQGVTQQELELEFDRRALVASIRAGIAAGAINPAAAVTVRFMSGNRELGSETIRVQQVSDKDRR